MQVLPREIRSKTSFDLRAVGRHFEKHASPKVVKNGSEDASPSGKEPITRDVSHISISVMA